MPKIKKRPLTRQKSDSQYGGGPSELSNTEPSTYRQIIRYFYHLNNTDPQSSISQYCQMIRKALMVIWQAVNPRLPLISKMSIEKKIRDILKLVKDINRKHNKASAKRNLDDKLDNLFDIAACSCSLVTLPCDDRRINCSIENCKQEHIYCSCPPNLKVPIEDRAYLRDQRLKTGPKGSYQMASIDRVAVKRDLRSFACSNRSTAESLDLASLPCASTQSSTESSAIHSAEEVSCNHNLLLLLLF